MDTCIKAGLSVLISAHLAAAAYAEFGVGAGAAFNYKASFQSEAVVQTPWENDPGEAVSGVDHFYDDGYNRVDSSGNFGNETTFWRYQNPAQDDGAGSITMSSARSIITADDSSSTQDEAQPVVELYWRTELTENDAWNIGLRTALRWQRIEFEESYQNSTITETTSDSYSYTGIPPGAPYEGSLNGPGFLLGDIPTRTISTAADGAVSFTRDLDADVVGLDIGPTLSWTFARKLRAVLSVGGTAAWINSEFSFSDGAVSSGSTTDDEWLFGGYAGADLQYQASDRWGLFAGVSYYLLQDFDQEVDGHTADLQMGGVFGLRVGAFFQ
jgi:hypothetical protein